jgi:UDP-N-acetylmuramyl pentapeptide synthase
MKSTSLLGMFALAAAVARELAPDVRILVKGSRMNRLERVVESLTATLPAARSA